MKMSTTQKRNIVVAALLILVVSIAIVALREPATHYYGSAAKNSGTSETSAISDTKSTTNKIKLVEPNRASLQELRAIGLDNKVAVSIIRYRSAGKIFRIKEELALCYEMTDSIYNAIEKHIIIDKEFQYKKQTFKNQESTPYNKTKKSSVKFPIDINKADLETLQHVKGIGEATAKEIIAYRNILGGFHSTKQLSEIKIITESNYEKILTQISANSKDISKIDVNFTPANELIKHPYISQIVVRKWISKKELRQKLKGGYTTIEEMIEDNIFTTEEAAKLQPYLLF